MSAPMPIEGGGDGECRARLTGLLLIEQRGTDPGAALARGVPGAADGASLGRWLAPAAALAAGEPKRALALLDAPPTDASSRGPGAPSALPQALRAAALALDGSWQPGGAPADRRPADQWPHFAPGTEGETADAPGAGPGLRLCTHLAGRVVPVLLSSRTTLGHAMRAMAAQERTASFGVHVDWDDHDLAAGLREPLAWFDGLYEEIAAGRHEEAAACHLLLAADLRVRAGDRQAAQPLLRHALRLTCRSHATTGLAALLAGDWELGPPGTAEQCAIPATAPHDRALSRAQEHYERADAAYRAAHAERGRAAALLRLAHVQRLRGNLEACRETTGRARALALAAGDGACAALLRVHQALDLIQAGHAPRSGSDHVPDAEAEGAEEVVAWATGAGSTSWLRGMRQLVLERAEFWSGQGEVVRARRAALLAQRLAPEGPTRDATADGPPTAGASVPAAGMVRRARHRLAAVVLTDLEQQDHLERVRRSTEKGEPPDLADLLGVIRSAKILHDQASALRDPEVMSATRARIELALRVGTDLLKDIGPMAEVLAVLASDLASSTAQETLFRSRRSRAAGLEAEADRLARQVLAETERIPDETFRRVLRCAAHVDLREWSLARAEMEAVEPRLSPPQAAALWLRPGPARTRRGARAVPRLRPRRPGRGSPLGTDRDPRGHRPGQGQGLQAAGAGPDRAPLPPGRRARPAGPRRL